MRASADVDVCWWWRERREGQMRQVVKREPALAPQRRSRRARAGVCA